jgi:hypothetical protein
MAQFLQELWNGVSQLGQQQQQLQDQLQQLHKQHEQQAAQHQQDKPEDNPPTQQDKNARHVDFAWPSDGADPNGNSCRNGFLTSPRSVFWGYQNDTALSLTEVYHAGGSMSRQCCQCDSGRTTSRLACMPVIVDFKLMCCCS